MPSVYVDVIGKCSILAGGATPPNNTAPLADPYPATGRPLPAASAAAAYAQACATSPPEASAASATSATSAAAAPACAPGYCAPGYCAPGYCAPACAPCYRESSAPTSAAAGRASAPTAASAAVDCKSYALAELGFVFLVEDIERRQADVSDFLFTESNCRKRCGLLQRCIRCRCSCVCAACHRQGHSGGPQHR